MESTVESMRQGLLAYCVSVGLGVFNEILKVEVEADRKGGIIRVVRPSATVGLKGIWCWVDARFKYSVPELGVAMAIRRFLWNLTGCFRTRFPWVQATMEQILLDLTELLEVLDSSWTSSLTGSSPRLVSAIAGLSRARRKPCLCVPSSSHQRTEGHQQHNWKIYLEIMQSMCKGDVAK